MSFSWLIRAIHILAAAIWVGGSFVYLVAIMPALREKRETAAISAQIAKRFKGIVNYCIGILILSGVYLTFDRLTQTTLGFVYLIVLGIKIALAIVLFVLAFYLGQSTIRRLAKQATKFSKIAPQMMLILGMIVFILGALLNHLYEMALISH